MSKSTWKVTRWGTSHYVSVTPSEVICDYRDADDLEGEYDAATENATTCNHAEFRKGTLQDWVSHYMGEEVILEVMLEIYKHGTSAEEAQRNDRTYGFWQMIPIDLMLEGDVKEADEDGFSRFALGPDNSTVAVLEDGSMITVPYNSQRAIIKSAEGKESTVTVPQKSMSVIGWDGNFYVAGQSLSVFSTKGKLVYSSAHDAERLRIGILFDIGNLFRYRKKIIATYRAKETIATHDLFDLTGRNGFLVIDGAKGITRWQPALR